MQPLPPVQDRVTRLLLIDDHPMYIEGVIAALKPLWPAQQIDAAHDMRSAMRRLEEHPRYDVVLMDWSLPPGDGATALTALMADARGVPIIVISGAEGSAVAIASRSLGAVAYASKTADAAQLLRLVREHLRDGAMQPKCEPTHRPSAALARGSDLLTPRQRQVHELIGRGLPNKRIADELNLALTTVRDHVSAILKRLHLSNRTEAALRARAAGPAQRRPKPPRPSPG